MANPYEIFNSAYRMDILYLKNYQLPESPTESQYFHKVEGCPEIITLRGRIKASTQNEIHFEVKTGSEQYKEIIINKLNLVGAFCQPFPPPIPEYEVIFQKIQGRKTL